MDDAALARCLGRFERRGCGAWTRARSRACPSPRPAGSRRSELAAQSPARLTAAMRARRIARRSRRRGELAARLALLALVALSRLARASDEADASVLVTVSACAPAAPSGALPAAGVRVADANARADETDPRPLLDDDRRPSPFATPSAVLLRVAPWVGGGAQVTLGVNWWNPAGSPAPSPAPAPRPTGRAVRPASSSPPSSHDPTSASSSPKRLRVDPSPAVRIRTGARFGVGMTAIVLAATRSRSSSLAALDAAEAFLAALPSTELASVWILSLAPRPILVSDFRRLDRGGASHVRARLREVRDALEGRKPATETDPERATNLFATNVSSPTRATRTSALASTLDAAAPRGATSARARVRQGALASVLAEIARVRNDAEGPAARDVVVVAPRRFDVGAANRAASDRVDATRGGGRWALSWLVRGGGDAVRLDAEAGPERGGPPAVLTIRAGWSEGGARRLAATILERRENVVRVGVCPRSREAADTADTDASASFAFSFEVPTTSEGGPSAAAGGVERDANVTVLGGARAVSGRAFAAEENQSKNARRDARRRIACRAPRPDPGPASHLGGSATACDARAAARDAFPYPDAVFLTMTPTQRAAFDARRAFHRGTWEEMLWAKTDMELGVRLGEASAAIPATARFRGVSSFRDCERRKSLRVNLEGGDARRLARGAASDEFLLVSMCYDDRYVKTKLVASLASEVGLFPHESAYVRVLVENPGAEKEDSRWENEGLYLLMDDPVASLERQKARLGAVVRRRNDAKRATEPVKGEPDVKRPKSLPGRKATLRRYDDVALVAGSCDVSEAGACRAALDERLDVEQYLTWMALMTFVESGDYVDEAWFFASSELELAPGSGEDAEREGRRDRLRFETHQWDQDDAFQPCHHDGENALADPRGLLHCAEADVDRVLLRDGAVYASYVDALERLLREDLAPAVVARVAETQARQIERALADDETAEGLEELIAANPEARTRRGALEDIEGSLGFYAWSLEQRRRELLRRVAAYRDEEEANQNIRTEPDGGGRSARTSEPMRALVASGDLELRASLRAFAYDANATQELVARNVVVRNRGKHTLRLGGRRGLVVSVVLRFDRDVVYEGKPYAAEPEEFRAACWRDAYRADDVATARATDTDGGEGGGRTTPAKICQTNAAVFAPGGFAAEAVRFPVRLAVRVGKRALVVRVLGASPNVTATGDDAGSRTADDSARAVALPPGRSLALGKISLHHAHWLPFADAGIASVDRDGEPLVRLLARER